MKQTVETQEKLINQKENILTMQNKTLIENEKEKEKKDEEIKELKSKINIYINNLKDNEKLLEENKKTKKNRIK